MLLWVVFGLAVFSLMLFVGILVSIRWCCVNVGCLGACFGLGSEQVENRTSFYAALTVGARPKDGQDLEFHFPKVHVPK